jgi:hypothetical protein
MQAKLVHSKTTNPAQQQTVPLITGLQDERKGMVLKWYLNSQTVPINQQTVPLMTWLQDERKGMVLKWYLNSQQSL